MYKYWLIWMLYLSNGAIAECTQLPIISLDSHWLDRDTKIFYTEEFKVTFFIPQSDLKTVRILINGNQVVNFDRINLARGNNGKLYELNTTIGPEKAQDAKIHIPPEPGFLTTEVELENGCVERKDIQLEGALSSIYAIVIGVSKYKSVQPNLDYAEQDARDVGDILKQAADRAGVDIKIEYILNERASEKEISKQLEKAAMQLSKEATLIVYFSGHGLVKVRRDKVKTYLVPYDGDVSSPDSTMLSHEDLVSLTEELSWARNKIVILDSCFAGEGIFEGFNFNAGYKKKMLEIDDQTIRALERDTNSLKGIEKMVWFSSARKGEVSYEAEELRHGIFTHYLLEGLRDPGWANNLQKVTYYNLAEYIKTKIQENHDVVQTPSAITNADKEAVELWLAY